MFGRYSLMTYVSRGSPALYIEEITSYGSFSSSSSTTTTSASKHNPISDWADLVEKCIKVPDDGHSIKFLRAVMNAERLCKKYEGEGRMMITGDMYVKIGKMLVDAVARDDVEYDDRWLRNVGFEEVWKNVPDRDRK